jgi:hypothetical protein
MYIWLSLDYILCPMGNHTEAARMDTVTMSTQQHAVHDHVPVVWRRV